MTTGSASSIGQTGATLSASYSEATATPAEVRFEYGTSAGVLDRTAYFNDGGLGYPTGSFSVTVSSLSPSTKYYYRAVLQVGEKEFAGDVMSFTTLEASQSPVPGWLELPAYTGGDDYINGHFGSGKSRNYSYLFDKTMYAALWSAYPLTGSHMSGSSSYKTWNYNPDIPHQYQIDVQSGSYGSNYNAGSYSRGHLVPSADRTGSETLRKPIYYLSNQTPQIQTRFNDGVWNSLEGAIRGAVPSNDTLYVVTGISFRKVGGSETIKYLTSTTVTPASVPVANYFWKVVLKVKRNSSGEVTSASSIGFWFEHKAYESGTYTDFAVSVDQIEQYTGFDLFANLPDSVESASETNSSWTTFRNF